MTIKVHEGLPLRAEESLRPLFDGEYADRFGPWDPRHPYGYSPFDVHVVAYADSFAVGHVGFQRRTLSVGGDDILVGGTGGVLVAESQRGSGLGRRLMAAAQKAMCDFSHVDFGYLGCREGVVGFYAACGWVRMHVEELSVPRSQHAVTFHPAGPPIMICSAGRDTNEWPSGVVDLRGRAW